MWKGALEESHKIGDKRPMGMEAVGMGEVVG